MYRVYDNKYKKWIKEDICLRPDGELMMIKKSTFGLVKLTPLSSSRFIYHRDINLYDKDGVLVYEGDYIRARVAEDREEIGLVSYAHELSSYVILCVNSDVFYTLGSDVSSEILVIGNVFDGYEEEKKDGKQALSRSEE